jgi:sulfide:quinone oxidoreductase
LIVGTNIGADTLRVSLQELKNSDSQKRIRILFVNPGGHFCAGPLYETLFMVEHWLKVHGLRPQIEVMLYTAEETFVAAFGPGVHHRVKNLLAKRKIPTERGMRLIKVEPGLAIFENGQGVDFNILVALSPQVGTHFGLPHTEKGFIRVSRETLQVIGQPNIYAIGDANDFPHNQGFLAMLQANAALRHLIMRLTGNQSSTFEALTMCIMHQGNTALFVQAPLRLTGKPNIPIAIDGGRREKYLVGTSPHWLLCKRLLGMAILESFRRGHPFHGGRAWKWFFGPCLKITTKLLARRALRQAD